MATLPLTISRIVCWISGPSMATFNRLSRMSDGQWSGVRFGHVVAVGEQAVLEVVDAEPHRLAERDRAEMAR